MKTRLPEEIHFYTEETKATKTESPRGARRDTKEDVGVEVGGVFSISAFPQARFGLAKPQVWPDLAVALA
jgi:hypothetical protein